MQNRPLRRQLVDSRLRAASRQDRRDQRSAAEDDPFFLDCDSRAATRVGTDGGRGGDVAQADVLGQRAVEQAA